MISGFNHITIQSNNTELVDYGVKCELNDDVVAKIENFAINNKKPFFAHIIIKTDSVELSFDSISILHRMSTINSTVISYIGILATFTVVIQKIEGRWTMRLFVPNNDISS